MKQSIVLFSFFFFFSAHSLAQSGAWTWMNGGSGFINPGVFGIQGVEDSLNTPPGLYEPVEWTDSTGNFWLFGGMARNFQNYADLWKYNPVTNKWTWVKGTGLEGDSGVFETPGIPSTTCRPGNRGWGTPSWKGLNGDLWLYGGNARGTGAGARSDLWRYNIASNSWTWMKGPNIVGENPVFGTRGVPSSANTPGGLYECSATWVDDQGNFWMFGGYKGANNDRMWKYLVNSNEWVWMKGSTTINAPTVYGTKGVADSLNTPGGRQAYSSWKDKNGKFWLFGGRNNTSDVEFSDMWMYDPLTNNWTWMSGPKNSNNGNYGQTCDPNLVNYPSSRVESRARWTDACGNFWLYGGGQGAAFDSNFGDLWFFNPQSLEWTLVNGTSTSNVTAVYGTKGVSSPLNSPGSRSGSVGWMDKAGDLYFFGGTLGWPSPRNDLWKFSIDTTCTGTGRCIVNTPECTLGNPQLLLERDTICASDSVQICAPAGFSSYSWNTGETSACIYTRFAGGYFVTVSDNSGCTALSNRANVAVYPLPPVSIIVNGDTLSSFGAQSYQWYRNGSKINGATNPIYISKEPGYYNLEIMDQNGCMAMSTPVLISGMDEIGEEAVSVYPNPSSMNSVQLTMTNDLVGSNLEVYDANGRLVFNTKLETSNSQLDLNVSKGVYFIRIHNERASVVKRWVKF